MEPLTAERPYRCVTCKFPTLVDDVELHRGETVECVCLRCYGTETGSLIQPDKQWRRQWQAAANDVP